LSLAFAGGLIICLVILGTLAAMMGRVLTQWKMHFAVGTAVVSAVAAIIVLLGPAIRRRVPDVKVRRRRGAAGAFVYGLFYSVATITTSAGPLMLLITIAAAIGKPFYGAVLSLAYAIGRAIPFLLIGGFAGTAGKIVGGFERYRRPTEVVSGIALMAISFYFARLAASFV